MSAIIDTAHCNGCGACVEVCPCDAIVIMNGVAVVNEDDCPECNACSQQCPIDGIELSSMVDTAS